MPRYNLQEMHAYPREELVNLLAIELRRDSGGGQPQIFESRIGQTNTLHVVVLWERWKEVPAADRAGVILDAYEKFDPATASRVTIAMGVTVEEGIELRLLPYAVTMICSNSSDENRNELVAAIKEEGGLLTSHGWQIRFPTENLANQAFARLWKKFPGYWALQHDASTVNS